MTAKTRSKAELGKALIEALGLPKKTSWVELRVAANEPVTVRCGYWPDALTVEAVEELCTELKVLHLKEVAPNAQ